MWLNRKRVDAIRIQFAEKQSNVSVYTIGPILLYFIIIMLLLKRKRQKSVVFGPKANVVIGSDRNLCLKLSSADVSYCVYLI